MPRQPGRKPDPDWNRECKHCGETKQFTSEFWTAAAKGNLRAICKDCTARNARERRESFKADNPYHFTSETAKAASEKGLARLREIKAAKQKALGEITGFLFEWALEHAADVAEGKIDAETSSELREWGKLVLEAVPGATVEINNQRLRALLERERKAAENDGSAAHAVPTAPAPPGNGDEPALFGPPPNDGAGVHPER